MGDVWPAFLRRFSSVLEKPRRQWTADETVEVWDCLCQGEVGFFLFKTVCRRVTNRDTAEEILQKCLAEMSLDRTYDPGPNGAPGFRTWVHACVHNHLVAYYKRVARDVERHVPNSDESRFERSDLRGSASAVEAAIDLSTMLETLEPRKRTVLTRQLQGETASEIASAMNIAEGYVRQLSFRAIRDLRKTFGITLRQEMSRLKP